MAIILGHRTVFFFFRGQRFYDFITFLSGIRFILTSSQHFRWIWQYFSLPFQKMDAFLELPFELSRVLIVDWCTVRDLLALDSSYCNKAKREPWWEVLRSADHFCNNQSDACSVYTLDICQKNSDYATGVGYQYKLRLMWWIFERRRRFHWRGDNQLHKRWKGTAFHNSTVRNPL